MELAILNNLYRPSLDWSIPVNVIYAVVCAVGACLLVDLVILLVRHVQTWRKRANRYEEFLQELGVSPAERIFLDHCSEELGIQNKFRMLTESTEFEKVREWAEKRQARKILASRIQAKMEAHQKLPPTARRAKHPVRPFPPVTHTA